MVIAPVVQEYLVAAIDDLLDRGGGLIVTGEPGAGRSTLLRWAAARRTDLHIVDDADRLDTASWERLTQAAASKTMTVLAAGPPGLGGLPVLPLRPFDDHEAHRLLLGIAPDLADPVAAGIMAAAEGNPGVLAALGGSLSLAQRRGIAPLPAGLPPHSQLGARLRGAVAALPPATRDALLLLAVEPTQLGALSDLSAAEAAGLIVVSPDGLARFRPRILGDVIYQDAAASDRRAAHLAVAEQRDGLAALIHRAAAAMGQPDPGLARELVAAAAGAAPSQAAVALRYAAALGLDPSLPLLDAARSFWLAGRPDEAVPLLHRASSHTSGTRPDRATPALRSTASDGSARPDRTTTALRSTASDGSARTGEANPPSHRAAVVRARARGLIAEIGLRGDPLPARDALLDVAGELLPHDQAGALSALLLAGEACCRAGDPGRFVALAAGLDIPSPSAGESLAVRQVRGLSALLQGQDESAFTCFRDVLDMAARVDDPALLIAAAMSGIMVGQDHAGAALARRAAAEASASGAYVLVPAALEAAAYAELAAGRYDAATTAALDGAAAARRYGRLDLADSLLALLAVLAGLVGDRATGEQRCRAATARHEEARDLVDWAYALLDLVEGRPALAAERLGAIVGSPPGQGSAVLRVAVIPHLIEAAGAAPALDGPALLFDRWARRTGEAAWLAMGARCRALRSRDAAAADDHFREALRRHDAGFARAHTELLYGRHLRRRRRSLEARGHLRHAAETFQRLDAGPWAAQAARELRAAGERAPWATQSPGDQRATGNRAPSGPWPRSGPWAPSDPGPPSGQGGAAGSWAAGRPTTGERAPGRAAAVSPGPPLTAQQERIAGLVADGATNREVAQQLHLSPRTVDHHLRNVFARLGVRSRTELARVLHD